MKTYTQKEVDQMRLDWEQSLRGIPDQKGVMYFPVDAKGKVLSKFKTHKHEYIIFDIYDLPIDRWTQFEKMALALGFGKTFAQFAKAVEEVKLSMLADQFTPQQKFHCVSKLDAIQKATIELNEQRFSMSFYTAAIFIVRDDEKLTRFDEDLQTEKIEDWRDYGYAASNFFLISAQRIAGFGKVYNEQRRLEQMRSDAGSIGRRETNKVIG